MVSVRDGRGNIVGWGDNYIITGKMMNKRVIKEKLHD